VGQDGLASIKFAHLEHEKNVHDWQGSQIAYIGFDELQQFSERMFFYMFSRNRSSTGIRPCIRATCNPDPDSWLAKFISWWIDQETGFPIPERDGVIRYFVRDNSVTVWGDTMQEVIQKCPHIFNSEGFRNVDPSDLIKSCTFIKGDIYGNKKLLEKDPGYLGNLNSLDPDERKKLLEGNWKISLDDKSIFSYHCIEDLFSNTVKQYEKDEKGELILDSFGRPKATKQENFITCDVARFGRDYAVVKTWEGFEVVKIAVYTISKTTDLTEYIEQERARLSIPKSNVLVDQDGVGGGVVDECGYCGFSGGAAALEDPKTKIKENYKNLKTQCAYRMADRVNAGQAAINPENYLVNGQYSDHVIIKQQVITVQSLIKQDLRSFKKIKADMDGKKQMIPKELQKNLLSGRSPDFGDAFIMREWFELRPQKHFFVGSL